MNSKKINQDHLNKSKRQFLLNSVSFGAMVGLSQLGLTTSLRAAPLLAEHSEDDQAEKLAPFTFDFNQCGYANNQTIPWVKAAIIVEPIKSDATDLIQQAIDHVSSLPLNKDGFRGAVLLGKGTFHVKGQLKILTSGVVLRGSGNNFKNGSEGTKLIATGNDRRTLIEIKGKDNAKEAKHTQIVQTPFPKPGDKYLTLNNVDNLNVGDQVFVHRPCTQPWIQSLSMDQFVGLFADRRLHWKKATREVVWDREISAIKNNTIYFTGSITTELETAQGEIKVKKYQWPGRIENIGIENLFCISDYGSDNGSNINSANPKDEEHAWICVNLSNVKNGWVRDLTAAQFVSSAVMLQSSASQITVSRCQSKDPVSEMGGLRRMSFFNGGQLNLIKDCIAENGRHDFALGHCSAGPNVFKDCIANNANHFSGSVESWACGSLFDNVTIVGDDLRFDDLKTFNQGVGWSASNCVLWNCNAAQLCVSNPPGSTNYIFGSIGRIIGDAPTVRPHRYYQPASLFDLTQAVEPETANQGAIYSIESPAKFVFDANKVKVKKITKQAIAIINGRFVANGKLFWSGHDGSEVWMSTSLPSRANKYGPAITRFMPGREGTGVTNDLEQLTNEMLKQDRAMMAHRPGLWYDRRRADHQVAKRKNGDVWGPFLEMPWARSGKGEAWDGLSKYDLTKFNPWYFKRIKQFADLCDQKQLLMYNEIYNNHNVVENASHWVDFPMRPANALQDIGIVEPPPFSRGNKSNNHYFIAIVNEFYDITHPVRRDIHKRYILKNLDNLKDNVNVIHTLGFQYSGDLTFAKFFCDTVIAWQKANNVKLKWALQTAKNITDALLDEPKYNQLFAIVDCRYWYYPKDGEPFFPKGGVNTAYRQQKIARWPDRKFPSTTPQLLYKQLREYTDKYPEKAIIGATAGAGKLPILMSGAAYALNDSDGLATSKQDNGLNNFIRSHLAEKLWHMRPKDKVVSDPQNNWCLADKGTNTLIYLSQGGDVSAQLAKGDYQYRWFSAEGDTLSEKQQLNSSGKISLTPPDNQAALLLINKVI